jgi:hypothetical protein
MLNRRLDSHLTSRPVPVLHLETIASILRQPTLSLPRNSLPMIKHHLILCLDPTHLNCKTYVLSQLLCPYLSIVIHTALLTVTTTAPATNNC